MTRRPVDLIAPRQPPRPERRATSWTLERGASVVRAGTRFSVWAPTARTVAVRVYDASGATSCEQPMRPLGDGAFEATVAGVRAGADYRYVLDGEHEIADPVSRWQPHDVDGPSRVVDPARHAWTDREWRGIERRDLVLYELHVGTFTDEGTFDAVIPHLAGLAELGVTAIELLPVAEFPGGRNWGYDGVHFYAPESSYGGPDGLRRLVDAAHAHGLGVLLDVVYNHTGPEGSVLQRYGPYFTDKYTTPWGGGPNTDGPDSDEVRRFMIDNALYWVTEYHLDGLRLDATEFIHDFSATHLLEELSEAVHEQAEALGRRVHVTTETALNDPRWVRPAELGGFGADAQWLDDFHHAVRTAITDERGGYYGDYHGVASVAKAYRDRFVYDGQYSPHWRRRRGRPARGVSPDRFITFVQNHDQIGNRAQGERLPQLASPAQVRLAAGALLLSPFIPLLFMGEEYGEPNPFLYFVSHHSPELLDAVRNGRRDEFKAFAWAGEVPDPGAEETFARSRLSRPDGEPHRQLHALHAELLRARRNARLAGAEPAVADDADAGWITLLYESEDTDETDGTDGAATAAPAARDAHLVVLNFHDAPRTVPLPASGSWELVLSTEDERFGGAGGAQRTIGGGTEPAVAAPAHAALLYRRIG